MFKLPDAYVIKRKKKIDTMLGSISQPEYRKLFEFLLEEIDELQNQICDMDKVIEDQNVSVTERQE